MYEIDPEKCVKVGDCINACPIAAIGNRNDGTIAVTDDCTDCGACEPVCDAKAIHRVH